MARWKKRTGTELGASCRRAGLLAILTSTVMLKLVPFEFDLARHRDLAAIVEAFMPHNFEIKKGIVTSCTLRRC